MSNSISQYQLLKEIDEKLSLDWESLFRHYVQDQIVSKGSTYYIPCPFHWENTPSFWVSFNKKVMKCFWCWRWYGHILLFLKDYLAITPQSLVERLQKDGFIWDIASLGEQFNAWVEWDIKKTIYKFLEYKPKESHSLMQRTLFDIWWIGFITKEKVQALEEMMNTKWKTLKKKEIAKKIIDEIAKHENEYVLINNEYNNILFYTAEKWSKTQNPFFELLDIHYVYNWSELQHIEQINKDASLFKNFGKQLQLEEAQKIWLEDKMNRFYNWSWYNKFLEKMEIDPVRYKQMLPVFFNAQAYKLQYFLWEGYFDVYSLWMLGIPYFTHWAAISAKKMFAFIKHLVKKNKIINKEACLNLCFDNDKAGILCTTRFVNQYMKQVKLWMLQTSDLDLRIFNYKHFEVQLSRLLSVLVSLIRKGEANILQMYQDLFEKAEHYNPSDHAELCFNLFFTHFAEVETDYTILKKFKKKYEFNYDEEKNNQKDILIKDLGELPTIIFAIQATVDKLFKKELNIDKEQLKKYIEMFIVLVSGTFNTLFFNSFFDVEGFKNDLNKKISSKEIERVKIDEELKDDYLFWTYNFWKKQSLENAFLNQLLLFHKQIDIELEALYNLNYLCYDFDLKENQLLSAETIKQLRRLVKSEYMDFGIKAFGKFLTSLTSLKAKIDEIDEKIADGDTTKETEMQFDSLMETWESEMKKSLLYFNLWIHLWNEKIEVLWEKVFLEKKYAPAEAKKIGECDKQYLTTPESKVFRYCVNHYNKLEELLEENIKYTLLTHGSQDNNFSLPLFKKALYKLKNKYK